MQMNEMKCQNCGAPMEYVTGIRHIQCASCGSEFILNGDDSLKPILYNGGALFHAYIPDGWNYTFFNDNQDISKEELVCFGIRAWSEDATLYFYPRSYYKDSNSLAYRVIPPIMLNHHKYLPIDAYVPQRISEVFMQAQNIAVRKLNDQALQGKASQFQIESQRVLKESQCEYGKYELNFDMNGQKMYGIFGTILCSRGLKPADPAQEPNQNPYAQNTGQNLYVQGEGQDPYAQNPNRNMSSGQQQAPTAKIDMGFFLKGGIVGAKMRGEKVPGLDNIKLPNFQGITGGQGMSKLGEGLSSLKKFGQKHAGGSNWGRAFDVILVTPSPKLYLYDGIFNDFALNVNYGPQYTALQEQERAAVENIMIQGQMRQQQIQMAGAQHVSQSIAQRNNIIMSGYEQRSARMDHMMQKYSEANRGVNSYTDNYGRRVEASVRYDHVYQNGSNYVGSDANLDLGPNWQELKRNE